jgi:hypothetical protein
MKITVTREHANVGDVLVSLDGGEPFHIPGDVTPFTALRMLGPWLEQQLEPTRAADGEPHIVTDPETGDASVVVDNVEVGRVADPKKARAARKDGAK